MGRRSSVGSGVKPQQDLYETSPKTVQAIIDELIVKIPNYKQLVLWEPFAGNNKIVDVIVSNGMRCVGTDKFTYDVSTDYLTITDVDIPYHDMVISNPPFCISTDILNKLYASNKPFIMLLPLVNVSRIKKHKLFMKYGIIIYIVFPTPTFLREGRTIQVDVCAWFYYSPNVCSPGSIVIKNCRVNV